MVKLVTNYKNKIIKFNKSGNGITINSNLTMINKKIKYNYIVNKIMLYS